MLLSGNAIADFVRQGSITIEPFDPERINPNSYNVRLDKTLGIYESKHLDAKRDNQVRYFDIPPKGLVLEPGVLYLGRTVEYTETHDHAPMLEGRSSLARLGMCVHVTAGFGDRGFKGHWTLEITVVHPLRIYPNMEVGQLCYYVCDSAGPIYQGKYNNDPGSKAIASRLHHENLQGLQQSGGDGNDQISG